MKIKSTERVARHRALLAAKGAQRMEVSIGRDVVQQMQELATARRCHLWEIVEAACEAFVKDATGNKL